MRRILLVLIILFSFTPVRYRTKYLPYPIPKELEDVYALDTLLSGYWEIRYGEGRLYPTMVGYLVQEDMENYTDWPSMEECMRRSEIHFRINPPEKRPDTEYDCYYEDSQVRVFVSIK